MLHVETATYLENYKMSVIFNDGSSHIVDFEKTIFNDHRPIISALKDISVFKDFSKGMKNVGNSGMFSQNR